MLAACAICASLVLPSCDKRREKYTEYSFDYFDTVTTVIGYEQDKEDFDAVCADVFELLGEYHKLYTIYDRYDGFLNLCVINSEKKAEDVDARIIDLLLYAKEMYALTDGRVNVAMGSVLSIWHGYRQAGMNDVANAKLPTMSELAEAAEHTDINDLIIDKEARTVTLADPQMKLDVGAIAKGYAVEMVVKELEARGVDGYLLNVGGNVRTVGAKPDGEKWTVGIENPDSDSQESYLAYLGLAGESLVTSGSYQRYYIVGGKRYHHIIDPDTLMPCDNFTSVSVVCKSSAQADALSTALFCASLEEGLALVESLPGVEAMWLSADGEIFESSGFSKYKK